MVKENKTKVQGDAPAFTKEQFVTSGRYTAVEKDVFEAVLQDNAVYTADQADSLVKQFKKGVVN